MNWQKGTPQMGEHRGSAQMIALEARIAKLEAALEIQGNGQDIKLSCGGKLTIEALNIEISSKVSTDIRAVSSMDISASAITSIKGAMVNLNGGGRPIARVGDTTAGSPASHNIITGSTTVMVP